MGKRRANNEGGLSRRPNGTWEARLTWVDPDSGARRRLAFYGPTAKAAAQKMKEARRRLESGGPPRDSSRTVGDWLAHWRETTLAASDWKQTTRALYAALARKHLEPEPFGATPLDRLRPIHVEGLVLALRGKKLSDSTVRQVYAVLRLALNGQLLCAAHYSVEMFTPASAPRALSPLLIPS